MRIIVLCLYFPLHLYGVSLKIHLQQSFDDSFPRMDTQSLQFHSSKDLTDKNDTSFKSSLSNKKSQHFIFLNGMGFENESTEKILIKIRKILAHLLDKEISEIPIEPTSDWNKKISLIGLLERIENFLITEGFKVSHRTQDEKITVVPRTTEKCEIRLYLYK